MGKSTLVKFAVKDCRRMILIDPMAEYENGTVVYNREDLYSLVTEENYFRVIFRPMDLDDKQEYKDIDYAADLALTLGNVTLVIDEVDNYCNAYYMSNQLRYCIQYGRHYDLSVVVSSRQANRIRNDITAQADYIITFQQQGKQSLAYLEYFSDSPNINKIIKLDKYYYVFIKGNNSLDIFQALP
jgi:hypothetical protein